jgi:hypothetical protein
VDGKNLTVQDIDLKFITTNASTQNEFKGNLMVPERGLIRFRFLEILIRLADVRYV